MNYLTAPTVPSEAPLGSSRAAAQWAQPDPNRLPKAESDCSAFIIFFGGLLCTRLDMSVYMHIYIYTYIYMRVCVHILSNIIYRNHPSGSIVRESEPVIHLSDHIYHTRL